MTWSAYLVLKAAVVTAALAHVLGADPSPSAGDVKPGWVALVIVLLLCVVTVLLWLSMRKHLGKIRFDDTDKTDGTTTPDTGPTGQAHEHPERDR